MTSNSLLKPEAIAVLLETSAEVHNSALLHSIGQNSSVPMQFVRKAFASGRNPFRSLHRHDLEVCGDRRTPGSEPRYRKPSAKTFDLGVSTRANEHLRIPVRFDVVPRLKRALCVETVLQ